MLAFDTTQVTSPGNYSEPKPGDSCHPLAKGQHPPAVAYGIGSDAVDRSGEGDGSAAQRAGLNIVEETQPSLRARPNNAVAYQCHGTNVGEMGHLRAGNQGVTGGVPFVIDGRDRGDDGRGYAREPHVSELPKVDATKPDRIVSGMAVRRLTPLECERLMGLPDNYTRIPYRNKPAEKCPDGPRYRALGNSMAVPVMRWLGRRIKAVAEAVDMEQPERSGA